jgi:1-hydroxycarotenoid 3,4-desaturase
MGGLTSAALLSARGVPIILLEKETSSGGKIRQIEVGGVPIDAGPTVFTMRDVLEDIFDSAGANLADHIHLVRANVLARHAWDDTGHLDLYADHEQSAEAIGDFAGAQAAAGFRSFSAEAKRIYTILNKPMLRASKVSWPLPLMWRIGLWRIAALHALRPYESLWKVLGEHFADPRLRQLFGRYTTYCGSSPFQSPATLMLIAHVEAQGVWAIKGGMSALACALETVATQNGAQFRYGAPVEFIDVQDKQANGVQLANGEYIRASAVICNADPAALGAGLFGEQARHASPPLKTKDRSLSAMVWLAKNKATGFPLEYHNVFFSRDYAAEFEAIQSGHIPSEPTAYVCALDHGHAQPGTSQRFQIIVNAPSNGDRHTYSQQEQDLCTQNMLNRLNACGLELERPLQYALVTPNDFSKRFPATGGAIYGRASHGWAASFLRQGSRTRIRGLYCAGGATHPGAGVPMAALSGKLASETALCDLTSTRRFHPAAIAGGMSTRSAMTGATG